jgi:hypothetical protein
LIINITNSKLSITCKYTMNSILSQRSIVKKLDKK